MHTATGKRDFSFFQFEDTGNLQSITKLFVDEPRGGFKMGDLVEADSKGIRFVKSIPRCQDKSDKKTYAVFVDNDGKDSKKDGSFVIYRNPCPVSGASDEANDFQKSIDRQIRDSRRTLESLRAKAYRVAADLSPEDEDRVRDAVAVINASSDNASSLVTLLTSQNVRIRRETDQMRALAMEMDRADGAIDYLQQKRLANLDRTAGDTANQLDLHVKAFGERVSQYRKIQKDLLISIDIKRKIVESMGRLKGEGRKKLVGLNPIETSRHDNVYLFILEDEGARKGVPFSVERGLMKNAESVKRLGLWDVDEKRRVYDDAITSAYAMGVIPLHDLEIHRSIQSYTTPPAKSIHVLGDTSGDSYQSSFGIFNWPDHSTKKRNKNMKEADRIFKKYESMKRAPSVLSYGASPSAKIEKYSNLI